MNALESLTDYKITRLQKDIRVNMEGTVGHLNTGRSDVGVGCQETYKSTLSHLVTILDRVSVARINLKIDPSY